MKRAEPIFDSLTREVGQGDLHEVARGDEQFDELPLTFAADHDGGHGANEFLFHVPILRWSGGGECHQCGRETGGVHDADLNLSRRRIENGGTTYWPERVVLERRG